MARWKKITEQQVLRMMDDAEQDGVRVVFHVAPAGLGAAGVLERTTDRSDRSVIYRIRDWRESDEDRPGLNHAPR